MLYGTSNRMVGVTRGGTGDSVIGALPSRLLTAIAEARRMGYRTGEYDRCKEEEGPYARAISAVIAGEFDGEGGVRCG